MPVDANLLASIGSHQPDLGNIYAQGQQMESNALNLKEQKQEQPYKLQSMRNELQSQQLQIRGQQLDMYSKQGAIVGNSMMGLHAQFQSIYGGLIAKGMNPAQAKQQANMAITPMLVSQASQLSQTKLDDGSPAISKQNIQHITDMLTRNGGYDDDLMQKYMATNTTGLNILKLQMAQHKSDVGDQTLAEKTRHDLATEKNATSKTEIASTKATDSSLSDDAIQNAATVYNQTGKLPATGMGGMAMKAKILNAAADELKSQGKTQEAATVGQAAFKANQTAMGTLQKQATLAGSFEKTALANMQLALDMSGQVSRTGSPILNSWILSGRKRVAGDPKVAAFDAAVNTFAEEYAKVMSGSTGGQAATDSARQRAHDLLNSADTPAQFQSVTGILKQEMGNRIQSFQDQYQELSGQMGSQQAPAAASGAKTVHWDDLK